MRSLRLLRQLLACAAVAASIAATACSSSGGGGPTGGGPVAGTQDMHCSGVTSQPTNQGDCSLTSDAGTGGSSSTPDYGATMYNSSGNDDDCKYHVSWTSTPIGENRDVTFTLSGTYTTDGMPNPPACAGCPVEGLNSQNFFAEVYLNSTHPAPPTTEIVAETSTKGTYTIGPVRFDAPGQWTVRFHLFELCSDIAGDSPHGHAAFYVQVP